MAALTIFETGALARSAELAAVVLILFCDLRARFEDAVAIGMSTGFLSHDPYLLCGYRGSYCAIAHRGAPAWKCPDVWKNRGAPNVSVSSFCATFLLAAAGALYSMET